MTRKKNQDLTVASPRRPVQDLLPGDPFLTSSVRALEQHKINEIARLLWLPEKLSEEDRDARILRALELYGSLAPQDGLEGMLAAQMVGTHHAVMECLRRAAMPKQTDAGRDMALKHAQKLMTLYTQQVAALDKQRGKGQQNVTVEYVNIEAGGQAIVGTVEAGRNAALLPGVPPGPALETRPAVPDHADLRTLPKRKR